MEINDTVLPVFVMLCGVLLIPALAVTSGLIFSLAADAGRERNRPVTGARSGRRWRRYEDRKITGK